MTVPTSSGPTLDRLVHVTIGGDLEVSEGAAGTAAGSVELREDGGFELREDGSIELRE
jgi:hypothetical protein